MLKKTLLTGLLLGVVGSAGAAPAQLEESGITIQNNSSVTVSFTSGSLMGYELTIPPKSTGRLTLDMLRKSCPSNSGGCGVAIISENNSKIEQLVLFTYDPQNNAVTDPALQPNDYKVFWDWPKTVYVLDQGTP